MSLYERLRRQIQERETRSKPGQEPREPAPQNTISEPEEDQVEAEAQTIKPEGPKPASFNPVCELCGTRYADPAIMKRHMERQHGTGIVNLNQPKSCLANHPGDPELERLRRELSGDHTLSRDRDWGRRWRQH
jgi:hypothetical protein